MRQVIRWSGLPDCAPGRITLAGTIPRSVGVAPAGPLRRWPCCGLIFLHSGRLEYADALARTMVLEPGDALLLVPETPHRFTPWRCATVHETFVSFEGPVFDALRATRVLDAARPFYRLSPIAAWAPRFAEFHRRTIQGEGDAVAAIGRLVHLCTDIAAARHGAVLDADAAWLAQARAALLSAPLRHAPRAAALSLGMAQAPFRKRFARLAGMPPARTRLRHALNQAAALLIAGDLSLQAVAERVGFADVTTFSRRFRAVMGQPPARFRRAWPDPAYGNMRPNQPPAR